MIIAVSYGEKKKADLFIISAAKIGQIPAPLVILNLIVFSAFALPFFGTPKGKGRKMKPVLLDEFFRLFDVLINF
jgi:hypothetical protein